MKQRPPHLVDHVGFLFDGSSSMKDSGHVEAVIKAAQIQVEFLAEQSGKLGREIRVSVWSFADTVTNLIWDMDVKHLPSIRDLYEAYGNTALLDACLTGIADFKSVPTKYGDHAFLMWLLTDGRNNRNGHLATDVQRELKALPGNWTFGALVPDQGAVYTMKGLGFAPGNISVWDTTSRTGAEEAGEAMRQATRSFTTGRSSGITGSKTLFDNTKITAATVQASGLVPLTAAQYAAHPVIATKHVNATGAIEIKDYVEKELGKHYTAGEIFYQLMKPEKIGPDKDVVIRDKRKRIYGGPGARAALNLPDHEIRVKPGFNPDYTIFVQSKSTNRHLVVGTTLLHIPK